MNWIVDNRASLAAFLPELILIGGAVVTLLSGAIFPRTGRFPLGLAALTLLFYVASVSETPPGTSGILFSGMIASDPFAMFFRLFFGVVSLWTLLMIARSRELKWGNAAEIGSFLLAITLGLSLMASATDLLMMFLSLEMVSVLSYVLVGYRAGNRASSEAGLKYILYGSIASGIMIFGFSYLFGLVGSTDFRDLAAYFREVQPGGGAALILFSLLCVWVGLAYKMATFPSQMWCPDVYEGAPLPVTAFLSVGPKAAGFAMTIRFLFTVFSIEEGRGAAVFEFLQGGTLIALLAAVTMTVGNLSAIPQRNLKRLLAYSSIAHAGYILMALAPLTSSGISSALFYLVVYFLMNVGAFFVLLVLSNRVRSEDIDAYRGLGWRSPFLAVCFVIFLGSLTGIPPFAGFIGKLYLFSAVIDRGIYWLVGVAAINTVISLFYYFRIVKTMFLEAPVDRAPVPIGWGAAAALAALAGPTLLFGVYWRPLWDLAVRAWPGAF